MSEFVPPKPRIIGVSRHKALDEFRSDLIIRLPDGGAERRRDARSFCPEFLHCCDGCLDHAGEGAAPAGMGRANHACLAIRE